jgi:hypothetical protein
LHDPEQWLNNLLEAPARVGKEEGRGGKEDTKEERRAMCTQ